MNEPIAPPSKSGSAYDGLVMPLQFDSLEPINRCGAALIAFASLIERKAIEILGLPDRNRTFASWQDVLNHIDNNTVHFRSGTMRSHSDFLLLDRRNRLPLTGRNPESIPRLGIAISTVLAAYLADHTPISVIASQDDIVASAHTKFVLSAATILGALRQDGAFAAFVETIRPERSPGRIVEKIVEQRFSGMTIPHHPFFPSLGLFDSLVVKSEFFTISDIALPTNADYWAHVVRNSFDMYAVIREARGWSAQDPADINFLVRDLLWLRGTVDPFMQYTAQDVQNNKPPIGFYISAVDNECFYIERIELQGPNIIFNAKSARLNEAAHRITFIFGASAYRHQLQMRDGVMSGFAEQGRNLGAWKALLIQPNWPCVPQLKAMLEQITIQTLNKAYDICDEAHIVGVCFSETMRQNTPEIQKRRESFRRLIVEDTELPSHPRASFGQFITDEIREILIEELRLTMQPFGDFSEFRHADIPVTVADLVLEVITKFSRDKWHLIEPAQIITFRQRPVTTRQTELGEERKEDIERLLQLATITPTRVDDDSGRHT